MSVLRFFVLAASATSAPVPEQHSCALVTLTHTNLPLDAASTIVDVYQNVIEGGFSEMSSSKIAAEIRKLRGGYWDVYFMGAAFSYSLTCIEYVELASAEWNVMMCRESVDEHADDCGKAGLTRYSNGTLTGSAADGAIIMQLDLYHNILAASLKQERALRRERAEGSVKRLLEQELRAGRLFSPGGADEIRHRLDELTLSNAGIRDGGGLTCLLRGVSSPRTRLSFSQSHCCTAPAHTDARCV